MGDPWWAGPAAGGEIGVVRKGGNRGGRLTARSALIIDSGWGSGDGLRRSERR